MHKTVSLPDILHFSCYMYIRIGSNVFIRWSEARLPNQAIVNIIAKKMLFYEMLLLAIVVEAWTLHKCDYFSCIRSTDSREHLIGSSIVCCPGRKPA